ncbi:MAG TPA: acetyl ornithine aminotransferase family protein, partial [Proteobacteria bacterium]|nr:acetyl ornithine aminotransferase family protein [Pseudomonadota bacterium]
VWDVDGRKYLDFTSGIAVTSTGHCHPDVVRAIKRQAEKLIHMSGTDFHYEVQVELAELLCEIAPGRFAKRVFFANSGAESVEAALKMARYNTRRDKFIAFFGAFHGRTFGALSLTASKAVQRERFSPLVPTVIHVPYAYCYRCPFGLERSSCELHCLRFIEEQVFETIAPPDEIAAIVVEPIQGEGGYIVPPKGFLKGLQALCRRHGILFIADEVQTGMGRTGRMFACEHFGIVPDAITVAKGIASGLPLGALVARSKLLEWRSGAHANTFGGNPISCAAALETIRLLREGLIENAARMGTVLRARLEELMEKYDFIGDVRGIGLMQAIEIVKDRVSKARDEKLRDGLIYRSFVEGLLLLPCGPSSIRFVPQLGVSEGEIDRAMRLFERAIDKAWRGRR